MFDAYRRQLDQGMQPLRIVLPFLYYHGSETWSPPEISVLFSYASENLKRHLPNFDLIFKIIHQYSDDQIQMLGTTLFTSLAQKYGQDPEELKKRIGQIYSIMDSWEGRNLFYILSVYILDILQVEIQELSILIEITPRKMKTEI